MAYDEDFPEQYGEKPEVVTTDTSVVHGADGPPADLPDPLAAPLEQQQRYQQITDGPGPDQAETTPDAWMIRGRSVPVGPPFTMDTSGLREVESPGLYDPDGEEGVESGTHIERGDVSAVAPGYDWSASAEVQVTIRTGNSTLTLTHEGPVDELDREATLRDLTQLAGAYLEDGKM